MPAMQDGTIRRVAAGLMGCVWVELGRAGAGRAEPSGPGQVVYPTSLAPAAVAAIKSALPPALNHPMASKDDEVRAACRAPHEHLIAVIVNELPLC